MSNSSTKDGIKAGVLIVLAVVVILALSIGIWAFRVATADIAGAGNQKLQTQGNANYRIAAYDSFYDSCASIQAKEDGIEVQSDLLTTYKRGTFDFQRISTNIAALKAARASAIRSYNADASKADTKAHFLASDLPYSINPAQEHTTCAR